MSQVITVDGLLWKPKAGCTSTADEFVHARRVFIELHARSTWNPWEEHDRAAEVRKLEDVMCQWTRAEPGHRYLTREELDAHPAELDAKFERKWKERKRLQASRVSSYDEARYEARLELLERQSLVEFYSGHNSHTRLRIMAAKLGEARRSGSRR